MIQIKKPGRPPKKRDWKPEQRFNWTVDFFKHPSVHTFIHLNGIEAVLPEFERLLSASGNECSNKQTHANLLSVKARQSLGVGHVIAPIAPSPLREQEFIQPPIVNASAEISKSVVVEIPSEHIVVNQESSVQPPLVRRIVSPPGRRSIVDDD